MSRRPPRLLIEDWLPAAAIGVECIRERSNLRARNEPFRIEAGTGPWALRGDADESGEVNITDPIALLNYLFTGGSLICVWAADVDSSGALDLTDAIATLTYLFLAGPPPAPPYPSCGLVRFDLTSCTGAGC